MLDPKTCTIAAAVDYAQKIKQSFGDIPKNQFAIVGQSDHQFLLEFLKLAHRSGDRIDLLTAALIVAPKPPNCDRVGTSQTCYYVRPKDGDLFHPVWFADCRKMIRSMRIREMETPKNPIAV